MIVLKHLSRQYDIDPHRLRAFLRAHNVPTAPNGRYQWESIPKSLTRLLASYQAKPIVSGSSTSPNLPPSTPSPQTKTSRKRSSD